MLLDSKYFAIISDMYQLRIQIITYGRIVPTISWINPEESMKGVSELKDNNVEDLILLYTTNNYLNLYVSGESELAKHGPFAV